MRQLFTWRFVAAVAALAGLTLLVNAIFVDSDDALVAVAEPEVAVHRIDLIAAVVSVDTTDDFAVDRNGITQGYADFTLDTQQVMRVAPGSGADIDCDLTLDDHCVVFVDLLGDAVIWVGVRARTDDGTVELERILDLQEGYALFDNGWQIEYASSIDRVCGDEDIVSFGDFLRRFGPNSITVIDVALQQVVRVRCAGAVPTVSTTTTTIAVVDVPVVPGDTVAPGEELDETVTETAPVVPSQTVDPNQPADPPVINE